MSARNKLAASGSFYFNALRDKDTLKEKRPYEKVILEGEIVVSATTKPKGQRMDTRPKLYSIRVPTNVPRYMGVSQTESTDTKQRTAQGFVVCTHGHVTMHAATRNKLRAGEIISFGVEEQRNQKIHRRKHRYGIKKVEKVDKASQNPLIGVVLSNQLDKYSTVDVLLHPARKCWIVNLNSGQKATESADDQHWRRWKDRVRAPTVSEFDEDEDMDMM